MEIKINFEKIHFWILLTAIVLIGGWIFVYGAGTQGHLWSEIIDKPAGFVDDVDNTGGTLTCTVKESVVHKGVSIASPDCPSGYTLTGGGCSIYKLDGLSIGYTGISYPSGNHWVCASANNAESYVQTIAICCIVQ